MKVVYDLKVKGDVGSYEIIGITDRYELIKEIIRGLDVVEPKSDYINIEVEKYEVED